VPGLIRSRRWGENTAPSGNGAALPLRRAVRSKQQFRRLPEMSGLSVSVEHEKAVLNSGSVPLYPTVTIPLYPCPLERLETLPFT
jgi:hypothetical protein